MKYLHFAIFALIVIFAWDIAAILPTVGTGYGGELLIAMLLTKTVSIIAIAYIAYKKFAEH